MISGAGGMGLSPTGEGRREGRAERWREEGAREWAREGGREGGREAGSSCRDDPLPIMSPGWCADK